MQTLEQPPAAIEKPKIIRRIRAYACEWAISFPGGVHGDDHQHQFRFLPGCFDKSLASGRDIALTKDLDAKTIFARTGDGSLRLTSDDHGLLVEAELRDTAVNRTLLRLIDTGRIRGWSFNAQPQWGGFTVRTENAVQFTHHHRAGLTEITLVINKVPRAKTRKTPVFI